VLRIEPPAPGQIERVLGEAESLFGKDFTACTENRRPKLSVLPAIDQPSAMLKDELLHGSGQRQRGSD
jgi:hypothetical protein